MQVYNAGVANLQVNFRSQAAPCDKTLAGWREPFSFDRQFSQALAQSVAIDPQHARRAQLVPTGLAQDTAPAGLRALWAHIPLQRRRRWLQGAFMALFLLAPQHARNEMLAGESLAVKDDALALK